MTFLPESNRKAIARKVSGKQRESANAKTPQGKRASREVLELQARGKSTVDIAIRLKLPVSTVIQYLQ